MYCDGVENTRRGNEKHNYEMKKFQKIENITSTNFSGNNVFNMSYVSENYICYRSTMHFRNENNI